MKFCDREVTPSHWTIDAKVSGVQLESSVTKALAPFRSERPVIPLRTRLHANVDSRDCTVENRGSARSRCRVRRGLSNREERVRAPGCRAANRRCFRREYPLTPNSHAGDRQEKSSSTIECNNGLNLRRNNCDWQCRWAHPRKPGCRVPPTGNEKLVGHCGSAIRTRDLAACH